MIKLYTDGSALGNPGKGAYAAWLVCGAHSKELVEAFAHTTNNRMELLAIIMGLEAIKGEDKQVDVYSDSRYIVDSVNKRWLQSWEQKGWKDRKNVDLWKRFLLVFSRHKIKLHWVKGHAGHPGNERCDELATAAAKHGPWARDTVYESIAKG